MFEKYVPDLDAYFDAWMQLVNLTQEKDSLELEKDELVAQIYIDCVNYPKYYVKDKPPAISFIEKTWEKVGHTPEATAKLAEINGKLIELNRKIAEAKAIMKKEDMSLSLYQTMSANSRNVTGYTNE
jgi:hypothetical protein